MKLTDVKLRALTQPGRYFDGGGLYLELTKTGGRYWRLKYRNGKKEKRLSLGVYPSVSLKEAREQADAARQSIRQGIDPGELRRAIKEKAAFEAANTLEAVAREWMKHQAGRWEASTAERIRISLESNVFKFLGERHISNIRPREVMATVQKMEARGVGEQATRVLQRVKAIYRWAVVHGRIEANPMLDLLPSEILKPRSVQHRPALPERELHTFLNRLDDYQGPPQSVNALRLLILTAVRPGEVRGAAWSEFDLAAGVWVIPAERMKMRTEHRVPLSRQALDVLEAIQPLTGHRTLVFPSPYHPTQTLSENTFNNMLANMGYKDIATAHGFRALFSTIANEAGWNPDAIERQLAHCEQNKVRAAYLRGTYMQDRERLMQWWADYLDARKAGNVVSLRRVAA